MQSSPKPKIYVVIGPTSSGKSEFAIKLAKKHNGEIISADSRQVYRGLNLGSGKVTGRWLPVTRHPEQSSRVKGSENLKIEKLKIKNSLVFIYKSIPHHCIDFVSPKRQYTVSHFKHDGTKAMLDILARGKTPIICGGTGQYVDALILQDNIPEVPPDKKFRKRMEKKSTSQLFAMLQKKDPVRAANIDPHNPRRLIRALEIIHTTGAPVPALSPGVGRAGERSLHRSDLLYTTYKSNTTYITHSSYQIDKSAIKNLKSKIIYLNPPREQLNKKIEKRLKERIRSGMLQEVIELHNPPAGGNLSWKRLDDLGLEYRYVSRFLQTQIHSGLVIPVSISEPASAGRPESMNLAKHFLNSQEYAELLREIKHYAKRQQTWFRKYQT